MAALAHHPAITDRSDDGCMLATVTVQPSGPT